MTSAPAKLSRLRAAAGISGAWWVSLKHTPDVGLRSRWQLIFMLHKAGVREAKWERIVVRKPEASPPVLCLRGRLETDGGRSVGQAVGQQIVTQ